MATSFTCLYVLLQVGTHLLVNLCSNIIQDAVGQAFSKAQIDKRPQHWDQVSDPWIIHP